MAPADKGIIEVEFHGRLSYFSGEHNDPAAYQAKKNKIAEQVITLLDKQFPGLRQDVEVVDVATLRTWEVRWVTTITRTNTIPQQIFAKCLISCSV